MAKSVTRRSFNNLSNEELIGYAESLERYRRNLQAHQERVALLDYRRKVATLQHSVAFPEHHADISACECNRQLMKHDRQRLEWRDKLTDRTITAMQQQMQSQTFMGFSNSIYHPPPPARRPTPARRVWPTDAVIQETSKDSWGMHKQLPDYPRDKLICDICDRTIEDVKTWFIDQKLDIKYCQICLDDIEQYKELEILKKKSPTSNLFLFGFILGVISMIESLYGVSFIVVGIQLFIVICLYFVGFCRSK